MAEKQPETPLQSGPDLARGRTQAGLYIYIVSAILTPEGAEHAPVAGVEGPALSFMLYWAWHWLRGKLD